MGCHPPDELWCQPLQSCYETYQLYSTPWSRLSQGEHTHPPRLLQMAVTLYVSQAQHGSLIWPLGYDTTDLILEELRVLFQFDGFPCCAEIVDDVNAASPDQEQPILADDPSLLGLEPCMQIEPPIQADPPI